LSQDCTPSLKIIKVGTISHEASELPSTASLKIKSDLGIGGGSTVTLIDGEQKILVDTGFDYESLDTAENDTKNATVLTDALRNWGIEPDDIDMVFITHWHRDHFGNLPLFQNAKRLASKGLVDRFMLKGFEGLDDGEELMSGVSMVLTPGHTIDHASIMVNTVLGGLKTRVAIAGDAVVSHSYFQAGKIWKYNSDFHSIEAAKESVLRLVNSSDIIIPGHGVPFMR